MLYSGSAIAEDRWRAAGIDRRSAPHEGPVIDLYPAFEAPRQAEPIRRRRTRRSRMPAWLAIVALALAISVALIVFRDPIANVVPPAADAYAAIGIPAAPSTPTVVNVETVRIYGRGALQLTIDGAIANDTGRQASLPSIEFALRAEGGGILASWSIAPARQLLAPGGLTAFSTSVGALPAAASDLVITIGGGAMTVIPLD